MRASLAVLYIKGVIMGKKNKFTRWLPLLIILIAFGGIIYFRWYEYLSFSSLQQQHQQLQRWTSQHYVLVVFIYMLTYIIAVALSVPGAIFLTLAGGYLFGIVPGTIYVVISATIGACIIFTAVKTALGRWLEDKASGWVSRMEKGFQENAFSYTLFLRLVPLFPFWVVNIVPALLDVRLRIFVVATFLGIIPGSFVYVLVGNGLGSILKTGQQPNLGIIFQPQVLVPLVALALLSLLPILYKKLKRSKA